MHKKVQNNTQELLFQCSLQKKLFLLNSNTIIQCDTKSKHIFEVAYQNEFNKSVCKNMDNDKDFSHHHNL